MTIQNSNWWRGGVIYQVYPRSFQDTTNRGVGDLNGVTQRLDYIASLGVDAIWLSPFFLSPMKDFGYDVADYRNIDPLFGTMEDFDQLVAQAHDKGLKIIIDQVLSHTSDQHPWFEESRQSQTNPKADWYIWADPKPDGTPPNNWLSIFGGSAWEWDTRRRQYYMHNFLASQPDLNFHNREVQDQLLSDVEFWLQRGVDGIRLDTVNFFFHDRQLRSNPPSATPEHSNIAPQDNPYVFQDHLYDKTQPENIAFLQRFRALLDQYPETSSVGEIGADNALEVMSAYTSGGDKLHMAYSFELLCHEWSAAYIRRTVESLEAQIGDGWPCWPISNHDVPRVLTRWGGANATPAMARAYMAVQLSIRGSVCLYQGDELGLPEADVPLEQIQDPYGTRFWPKYKGRDGCRTPMPWRADAIGAAFTTGQPWLPIPQAHRDLAANLQEHDEDSVLSAYRRFLRWRANQPALIHGAIDFLDAPAECLFFVRQTADQRLLVAINLSAQPQQIPLPSATVPQTQWETGFGGTTGNEMIHLQPWDAWFGFTPANG